MGFLGQKQRVELNNLVGEIQAAGSYLNLIDSPTAGNSTSDGSVKRP